MDPTIFFIIATGGLFFFAVITIILGSIADGKMKMPFANYPPIVQLTLETIESDPLGWEFDLGWKHKSGIKVEISLCKINDIGIPPYASKLLNKKFKDLKEKQAILKIQNNKICCILNEENYD